MLHPILLNRPISGLENTFWRCDVSDRCPFNQKLNQCWNIVNSNIVNKLQSNLKRNSYIFIQENTFEYVLILSRPQCVKYVLTNISDHFNVQMLFYQYKNNFYKDKVVSWPSYLHNGNPDIWKDVSFLLECATDSNYSLINLYRTSVRLMI